MDHPGEESVRRLEPRGADALLAGIVGEGSPATYLPAAAAASLGRAMAARRKAFAYRLATAAGGPSLDQGSEVTLTLIGVPDAEERRRFAAAASLFSAFFSSLLRTKPQMDLAIYYAPCKALGEKQLLMDGLAPEQLNSGVTFTFGAAKRRRRVVLVYRAEEALKVLVHELVHAYDLDDSPAMDAASAEAERLVSRHRALSTVPVRAHETYTELLAAVLYTVWLNDSPRLGDRLDDEARMRSSTTRDTSLRRLFAFFDVQSDKLLCVTGGAHGLRQRTHALEYVVAKAAVVRGRTPAEVFGMLDDHALFGRALLESLEETLGSFRCGLASLPGAFSEKARKNAFGG